MEKEITKIMKENPVKWTKLLKKDLSLFTQQKRLIESQLKSSKELFTKRFGKEKKIQR